MAAHQAPLFLGFSNQEHWSGLPFPSPMYEVKSESEVAQSIHEIFQARVLEWGSIAFSNFISISSITQKVYCEKKFFLS